MSFILQNQIYQVKKSDIDEILKKAMKFKELYLVELNGKEIQTWKDYILAIENLFKLPTTYTNNIDAYNDWMRDLDWLKEDNYMIVIYNYKDFLKEDVNLKNIIMNGFLKLILPWWQSEVEKCVVGGKSKYFNVYIVD